MRDKIKHGQIPAQFHSGGTYFFTVTLADRRSSALVDYIGSLRAAFRLARSERPFAVDAIVILPDHLHAILTLPPGDSDFSGRWRRSKSAFTRRAVAAGAAAERNERGEYGLWQRRFWEHTVRDDGDFARHVDYIHFNPINHGIVTHVSEWPYSSFHHYVRRELLPDDWAGTVDEIGNGYGERKG